LIFLLTGGGPIYQLDGELAGATDILISYTYKIAFNQGNSNLGLASAISVLIFLIVASISLYGLRKSKVLEDLK
jgi:arabinogalactan oligomer/maltooligosaccharide transport system permease protein